MRAIDGVLARVRQFSKNCTLHSTIQQLNSACEFFQTLSGANPRSNSPLTLAVRQSKQVGKATCSGKPVSVCLVNLSTPYPRSRWSFRYR